jgi:hypothetical protein
MTPLELLEHCEKRIPFTIMRSILKAKDMTAHAGWSKTVSAYKDKLEEDPNFESKVMSLENTYKHYLLAGDKVVSIYKVTDDITDAMLRFTNAFNINNVRKEDCVYEDDYPFPVKNLTGINADVEIVYSKSINGKLTLGFCSTRKIEEHVKVAIEELDTDTQANFSDYTELFGTKRYRRQLFDFVVIDTINNYVEYRIDASNGLSVKDIEKSLSRVKATFLTMLHGTDVDEHKLLAHNLYPKIGTLYDSNEGRVCELSFTVDSGGTFNERMRGTTVDIRNEEFHSAGMQAVKKINTYKIAVRWPVDENNEENKLELELLLNSSMHETYNTRPTLFSASILKCYTVEQYNALLAKIL